MVKSALPWGEDVNAVWKGVAEAETRGGKPKGKVQGGKPKGKPDGGALPGKVDGRVARSQRTRAAVLDALIALLDEGQFKPPAKVIAERSGVSTRSVFQHFPDLETLLIAAVELGVNRFAPSVQPIPTDLPRKARIDALVEQRFALFERAGNVYWAGQIAAPISATLKATFAHVEYALRVQIGVTFKPELATLRKPKRLALIARIAAATGFHHWYALRRVEGVDPAAARAAMAEMLAVLLPE
ncbi:TetR/AcrR family transcriptional regulator [Zavarzinia aquatilis]|uniref:TetR/AcrR family transcriptional regulator n=1 Tax=Zavarzinia aquatilis TaxID=2211142 RepID=UPI001057C39D|nr:TetR/AcrR family transcriptional regulator [Zavarzinia aquatilis]